MYNFFYHIPSTMPADRWIILSHLYNVYEHAARKAVLLHFLGSERPESVEIWVRKKKGHKIKKLIVTEKDNLEFEIHEKKD